MDDPRTELFRVFNEIGIINQLATAILARQLPGGVHPSQFNVLGNLTRLGDGKTPKDLADAFQVPKASMTNTLMQLEKRKLIALRPHPDDQRKKQVFLTDAGRAFYVRVLEEFTPTVARLSDRLGNIEALLPALERIRITLDENRDL